MTILEYCKKKGKNTTCGIPLEKEKDSTVYMLKRVEVEYLNYKGYSKTIYNNYKQ